MCDDCRISHKKGEIKFFSYGIDDKVSSAIMETEKYILSFQMAISMEVSVGKGSK